MEVKVRDFMYELNDEVQLPDKVINDAIVKFGANGISFRREIKALDPIMFGLLEIDPRLHKPIENFFKDIDAPKNVEAPSGSRDLVELDIEAGAGPGVRGGGKAEAQLDAKSRKYDGHSGSGSGVAAPVVSPVTPGTTELGQKRLIQEQEMGEKKRRTNLCIFCNQRPDMPRDLQCSHTACASCLHDAVVRATKEKKGLPLKCTRCKEELQPSDLRTALYPHEFQAYNEALLQALITSDENMVKCIKCPNVIEVVSSKNLKVPKKILERDSHGNPLTREAWKHYKQNRLRCTQCNTVFCGKCKDSPYHMGYSCEGWVEYKNSKQCRFCSMQITAKNEHKLPPLSALSGMRSKALQDFLLAHGVSRSSLRVREKSSLVTEAKKIHAIYSGVFGDICEADECKEKRKLACTAILPCGCPCGGIRGEGIPGAGPHLPCMKCTPELDPSEFCPICYVESLSDAPCIQSTGKCKHIFHLKCVIDRINAGYNGARINFKFLTCPLCQNQIEHPALSKAMRPWLKLRKKIEVKALERLKYEKRENDPKIASSFGGSAIKFACHEYLFYKCFKCKQPYFAGNYACQAADDGKFDPAELLCAGCQPSTDVSNCPTHGNEWITFKCRFCCNTAQWYSQGTLY